MYILVPLSISEPESWRTKSTCLINALNLFNAASNNWYKLCFHLLQPIVKSLQLNIFSFILSAGIEIPGIKWLQFVVCTLNYRSLMCSYLATIEATDAAASVKKHSSLSQLGRACFPMSFGTLAQTLVTKASIKSLACQLLLSIMP